MKRLLLIPLFLFLLLLTACSANDPLTENLYTDASYIKLADDGTGGYWHLLEIAIINVSPGSSGATQITPNASSLGGYRLDAINEFLYFDASICTDWDGVSDAQLCIMFEVNEDNTLGLVTDTVKIQVEAWHKIPGELICTVQSLEGNTVVGQSDQHELFIQTITIPNIRTHEIISFRINLNTVLSQVTNIIVNQAAFRYPSYYPSGEVD